MLFFLVKCVTIASVVVLVSEITNWFVAGFVASLLKYKRFVGDGLRMYKTYIKVKGILVSSH